MPAAGTRGRRAALGEALVALKTQPLAAPALALGGRRLASPGRFRGHPQTSTRALRAGFTACKRGWGARRGPGNGYRTAGEVPAQGRS